MTRVWEALLVSVLVLSTSIWFGGYVAIAVVARTATSALEPAVRVSFFRTLGRSYLRLGGSALVVAYASGAVLLRDHVWDALLVATVVVAVALALILAVGVIQARRMTRLRRSALPAGSNDALASQVARGGRATGVLRAALGLLSLALVVMGSFLAA